MTFGTHLVWWKWHSE